MEKEKEKQSKLENFFTVKIYHNKKNKKCFIYDRRIGKAFFETEPMSDDTYIVKRAEGIKLYCRGSSALDMCPFPIIETTACIPLLKSNIQKAVRRGHADIATASALAILQKNPMQLLRRLPIIYIEDVCLHDSYPVVVWLMMADKEYTMTQADIQLILKIVNQLALCPSFYDRSCETDADDDNDLPNKKKQSLSHTFLQDKPEHSILLSLYYRMQYGGMKCDVRMLEKSIYYYMDHPDKIRRGVLSDTIIVAPNLEILVEAIDFHPFPSLLNDISRMIGLEKEVVKEFIWFVESAYNRRKPETIEDSKRYEERREWKKIERVLEDVRMQFIF